VTKGRTGDGRWGDGSGAGGALGGGGFVDAVVGGSGRPRVGGCWPQG